MNFEIMQKLAIKVNAKGYVAVVYPRLKKVAINGGRLQDYPEAYKRMNEMLKS